MPSTSAVLDMPLVSTTLNSTYFDFDYLEQEAGEVKFAQISKPRAFRPDYLEARLTVAAA